MQKESVWKLCSWLHTKRFVERNTCTGLRVSSTGRTGDTIHRLKTKPLGRSTLARHNQHYTQIECDKNERERSTLLLLFLTSETIVIKVSAAAGTDEMECV